MDDYKTYAKDINENDGIYSRIVTRENIGINILKVSVVEWHGS